jgi:two-component system OmpR family sensor kinase
MLSLRARLLAGLLALAAAGLVLVGAITYTEQRSFLEGRVDQQVRTSVGALSEQLDADGAGPAPYSSAGRRDSGETAGPEGGRLPPNAARGGRPPGGAVSLPPGTFGQRRLPGGNVLRSVQIRYSSSEELPSAPRIPADVPVERLFTVGSADTSYRVFVSRDPEDPGLTLAAVPLTDVNDALSRLLLVEGAVIGGVLLALAAGGFFVVRLGLRPLDRMEVTAEAIAGGDLSRRVSPANRKTEVGRLGLALNRMLDRLEEAFTAREASTERLRRFLADASHELRTPLASIRGYAELFRMGATDAGGTEEAMRRIEEEARRMGVLVEDLLILARLDEAPELRRQQVDVAKLARDAVADARATAPDRTISVDGPAKADVRGDPNQLHQVVANLMRNALSHTPGGTPIEVSVWREGDEVAVRVRDHGPGIPAGAGSRLFDRFWRAEKGRERGRGGAGLGLAIASEIVSAHGGRIHAENAPGGGARFTLHLPAAETAGAPQTGEPAEPTVA